MFMLTCERIQRESKEWIQEQGSPWFLETPGAYAMAHDDGDDDDVNPVACTTCGRPEVNFYETDLMCHI